jgi:hypothetical protein
MQIENSKVNILQLGNSAIRQFDNLTILFLGVSPFADSPVALNGSRMSEPLIN